MPYQLDYFAPTVLRNMSSDMRLTCEEVFDPVMSMIPANSEAEVIASATNTESGLAATVLTRYFATAVSVGGEA